MKNKVLKTIQKYTLIENGDILVLGVSGGPDSITMLDILNEIKNDDKINLNFEIIVCHINHMIREEANEDEEYVKKYLDTDEGEVTPKKKRLVIVNDVRIYLNSIKQIVSTIKDVGIPVSMEQDVDGGDVLVTLRIRNTKKPKEPRLF